MEYRRKCRCGAEIEIKIDDKHVTANVRDEIAAWAASHPCIPKDAIGAQPQGTGFAASAKSDEPKSPRGHNPLGVRA